MTLEKKDIHKHTLEIIYRAIKQRDAETFKCIFALSYVKEGIVQSSVTQCTEDDCECLHWYK